MHDALNYRQDKQHDGTIVLQRQAPAIAQLPCHIAVVVPASTSLSCQWCDVLMSLRQLLNVLNDTTSAGVNIGLWWLSEATAKGYNSF